MPSRSASATAPAKHRAGEYRRSKVLFAIVLFALSITGRTGKAELEGSDKRQMSVCLSWTSGPEECPTPRQIQTAVEEILDSRFSADPPCNMAVRGEMRQLEGGGGWGADLSFIMNTGEDLGIRRLQSRAASCAALKDPVALVIALIVGEREPQATLQVPSAPPPIQAAAEPTEERRTATSATFVLSSGLLPQISYGAGIDWSADVSSWMAIQGGASLYFPQASKDRPGGEFWAWLADVALCPKVLVTETADGWICLGGRAGGIHGSGLTAAGINGSESQVTKPYGDAEAHAKLSFPVLGSMTVVAQLGVAVPWLRPRFIWTDAAADTFEVVHQPKAAVFFAAVGFELQAHAKKRPRGPAQ